MSFRMQQYVKAQYMANEANGDSKVLQVKTKPAHCGARMNLGWL